MKPKGLFAILPEAQEKEPSTRFNRIMIIISFVLLAAWGLSSAVPSTPGYVGVYQFVAVTVLTPFGISKADALAFILISQILGYLIFGFWGILSLWQFNKQTDA